MNWSAAENSRIAPAWWTVILLVSIAALVATTCAVYAGVFTSYLTVTLVSDRAGLVMDPGAKVKMRGVPVGHVAGIASDRGAATLKLEILPDQADEIPANVEAQIRATTAFGAKYVDLIYPEQPSSQKLAKGAVLRSRNVATEVQTVFQNLVNVFAKVDPPKLNAVLTAVAQALRGRGPELGSMVSDSNTVLAALNSRTETLRNDWVSLKGFADTYGAAAQDILAILDASAVTSSTLVRQVSDLDTLLLNTVGFAQSGIELMGQSRADFIKSVNTLESTTALLHKYSPQYPCFLQGAKYYADTSPALYGADGRSSMLDAVIGFAADPYRYPEHLPKVGARGGPGGKPSCGSLPIVSEDWPQRYLVTDTGFGTGLDKRPNPGIAHPWWVNFLPVTRAVPEAPSVRGDGPPAIGPVPYPGAPPYGAPVYGPGGVPLYPGVPPATPAAAPQGGSPP